MKVEFEKKVLFLLSAALTHKLNIHRFTRALTEFGVQQKDWARTRRKLCQAGT